MSQPAPMITKDGRFAYEAAGDPDAIPLIFLHGIGGAARAWRRQLATFGGRFRAIAWDMPGYGRSAPLASVSIATLAEALQQFIEQLDATRPILVGHSIGGMIVQKWLVQSPKLARAVVLAQTSPAFGKADGDWQKSFIAARLGPLDRGETMKSLAPSLVKELVGDDPDPNGYRACTRMHGERARGKLSCHDAGSHRLRPAQHACEYFRPNAAAVGFQGQQCARADDGKDCELHPWC
ncbi:pimeloyl-ACP methyl ester carboxylesterase [Bradyrhizobium japonicum]